MRPDRSTIRWGIKPVLWLLLLAPGLWLGWGVWRAWIGDPSVLGTDPAETLIHTAGETALRLLLATLLIGSLRAWFGLHWLVQVRRLLGVATFAWAAVHLGLYVAFELEGALSGLGEDLRERPYIIAGATALVLMLPLAVTSTRGWQRRLGPAWGRLHRLVYPAAAAACVHLLWQSRSDLGEALLYCTAFAVVGGQRLVSAWRRRRRRTGAGTPGAGPAPVS